MTRESESREHRDETARPDGPAPRDLGQERDRLAGENARLRGELESLRARESAPSGMWVPPGHFYSPIPDPAELERRSGRIFGRVPDSLPGIDLRQAEQIALLETLAGFSGDEGFVEDPQPGKRYHVDNTFFPYADAFALYGMMRHFQPRRIVEVGSGFSSAVMLDTREALGLDPLELTFVEPYPERLRSLLEPGDEIDLRQELVQDVEPGLFRELGAGDILFIDSSHVSKTGSDVNHLLFEVLPSLEPGVLVHVHDIHYPFEYPRVWVDEGRAWNEVYALRAFLQFNRDFRIRLFVSYLGIVVPEPLWRKHMRDGGTSLWLERL